MAKIQRNNFLKRGDIPTTSPVWNRVNFTCAPMGKRVKFHFESHKMFIHSISIALSYVEDCQYTCPGGWVDRDEEQLIMSRLRIRLSQPNLAEVGVGAELGNNQQLTIITRTLIYF